MKLGENVNRYYISAKFENPPITLAIKSYGPLFIQNNVKFALSALQLKQMLSDLH